MNYKKLKEFDLLSIKSQEQADEWKTKVLESNEEDILKYINFLRFQQFNGNITIKYMERIIQFLSYDELIDIERSNSEILTGDIEDLVINAPAEIEQKIETPIKINGEEFSVKAELYDDFETVVVVDNGEKLVKYGFIDDGEDFFAYELFEESQEFLEDVIDAEIGTKINLYADVVNENQVTKTFKKVKLEKEYPDCILTKKTDKGVLTPIYQGSYKILKKEILLSADGVSEERMASHLSKLQKEIAEKLGDKVSDLDVEEKEKEYNKSDFEDDFKFSEEYCFSIETPDQDWYNQLSETILYYRGLDFSRLDDEYVEEIYQLLSVKFGVVEETNGVWSIPNTKLESVLRTIVRAGGKIKIGDEENASMFFKKFIKDDKLEKIIKTSKHFEIVKKLRNKKDVQEFVKDAGTELYNQIGQTTTAILEGTQRLYGEGHIVFDSDYKLTICQFDGEVDLVSASNYAIDNGYKNFYIIEKDKYTQYDAWYKETLKNTVETETDEETKRNNKR